MANLLLKHVPDDVLKYLKLRAKAHGQSVQDEALAILTSVCTLGAVDAASLTEKVRKVMAEALISEERAAPQRMGDDSDAKPAARVARKAPANVDTKRQVEKPTQAAKAPGAKKRPTATQQTQIIRQRKSPR